MTKLKDAVAPSSEQYLAGAGLRLAELCTACGACFQACPMTRHVGISTADPAVTTDGLRRLARGDAAPDETVKWVGACGKSGLCVAACPERDRGLDAMLLVRIARQQAINVTGQLKAKGDPLAFPRVKTFARLQLTDEEIEKWL